MSKMFTPTVHILVKTEKLHHGVLWQLSGLLVSHTGITGAGKHVAPVLPPCVDARVLYLQENTFLDAVKDAVGVIDLIKR